MRIGLTSGFKATNIGNAFFMDGTKYIFNKLYGDEGKNLLKMISIY